MLIKNECPQIRMKNLKDRNNIKLIKTFKANGQNTFLVIFQNL